NASGKTTLSRAIQRSLRPCRSGRDTDSLVAEFEVAGQSYELDLHLGQPVCRSGGVETALPELAPSEVGERYVLALHDLVQLEEERDIVRQILTEAAGGYDVSAAAEQLGFDRVRIANRGTKAVREHEEARRRRKKAEDRLAEIEREENQLTGLEQERNKAHQAQLRVRLLEDALKALDEQRKLDEARQVVTVFPTKMSKLVGD